MIPIIRDPAKVSDESDAVFYFPGCGSERLFSDVGLATLAMLYESGAQTVLPPGYLCCGYPQTSAGLHDKGQKITTDNRVLFHRVANTLNYMDIKTVIVSCGTCMDQLLKYEFEKIFPGCRLLDIHEYLMEKGVTLGVSPHPNPLPEGEGTVASPHPNPLPGGEGAGVSALPGGDGIDASPPPAAGEGQGGGTKYLYHDPCHTPMKTHDPLKVAASLMGQTVMLSDRCCGEAGTLGTARPDIANQLRFRKLEELHQGIQALSGAETTRGEVKMLTSCPACQQGLARYADETGLKTDYIVVELARHLLGQAWQQTFVTKAKAGGIERVLL
jgi:Fe-S oxidoreductase